MGMKKILLVGLLVIASACEDDPDPSGDKFSTFDRQVLLGDLAKNVIRPGFDSMLRELTELEQSVQVFTAAPTEANLVQARTEWIQAARAWKRVEFFKLGLLNESLPMLATIDIGAADPVKRTAPIDSAAFEQAIATGTTVNVTYVESQAPSLQGIPMLEYLLFRSSLSAVVQDYTQATNAEQRKAYLFAVAQTVRQKIGLLVDDWGGGYENTFRAADGRDIGSSIGMLVNDLAFLTEAIKNEKIGRPLGFRTAGIEQPSSVEARLSGQSLQFILDNLTGIEQTITGDGVTNGIGLADLLRHVDAKYGDIDLSTLILQQIQTIRGKIEGIQAPLPEAVVNNTEAIQQLYDELKKLVVLIKVDVANNLGVMITYTDNDGD